MKKLFVSLAAITLLLLGAILPVQYSTAQSSPNVLDWQPGTSLNSPRATFGFATNGEYIYLIGGCDMANHYLNTGTYAKVNEDGSLGTWQSTPLLKNQVRVESGVAIAKGRIYVFGGYHYTDRLYDVQSAIINPDGSLSEWTVLPGSIFPEWGPHWAAVYGDFIYFLCTADSTKVIMTRVNDDGGLGAWQYVESPDNALGFQSGLIADGGYLYCIGGGGPNNTTNRVQRARILADGSLGYWEEQNSMVIARDAAQVVVVNGYIYALGGITGASNGLSSVERAFINPDGTLGSWELVDNPMPRGRDVFGAVTINNVIYAIGGSTGPWGYGPVIDLVDQARVLSPPPSWAEEFTADSNTVALWHFNEGSGPTVYDASPGDHDGTLAGAAWVAQGLGGHALDFGTGKYVEVPDIVTPSGSSLDGMDELTIEAWVYLRSYPPAGLSAPIVSKYGTGYTEDDSYQFLITDTGQLALDVEDGNPGDRSSYMYSSDAVPLKEWTLVKGTWKKASGSQLAQIHLFINNEESIGIPLSIAGFQTQVVQDTSQPIQIGRGVAGVSCYFDGIIDEVRISNVARTEVTGVTLAVPYYNQDNTGWCWATSLSMLLSYYGYDRKPWQIAADFNMGPDQGASWNDADSIIEPWLETYYDGGSEDAWGKVKLPGPTYPIPWYTVLKQAVASILSNGHPVWLLCGDRTHVIVITGIEGTDPADHVYFNDPSDVLAETTPYIRHALTWDNFIEQIDVNPISIYGEVVLIYGKTPLLSYVPSFASIEVRPDALQFSNWEGGRYKSLQMKWDGTYPYGYRYQQPSGQPKWYSSNTDLGYNATRFDQLLVLPSYSNYSLPQQKLYLRTKARIYRFGDSAPIVELTTDKVPVDPETWVAFPAHGALQYDLKNMKKGLYRLVMIVEGNSDDSNTYNEYDCAEFYFGVSNPIGFKTTCPVDLLVTDPEGHTISKGFNEIAGATYIEEDINGDASPDDIVLVSDRLDGMYEVTVVPEPDTDPFETFTLEVVGADESIVLGQDIPIIDIPGAPYVLDVTETEINSTPVVYTNGPYDADEGLPITLNAYNSYDPDGTIAQYEWDFDEDGVYDFSSDSPIATYSYGDDYYGNVTLKVTDDDGLTSIDKAEVTVNNVPPTIHTIIAPLDPVAVNSPVSVFGNFTDPGWLDTHTAIWDWGDGSTSSGTITESNGSGNVTGSHTYTSAGVYTVALTVTDDDGDSDTTAFQYVVVYDPSAGFVTGGGWINSPIGAYTPDISLAGKATFGFVSKYQKGATVPTGQTQFQFHVANMDFKSTSYQWLVISGARAKYKGTGTINGAGNYGFMLSAIDGQIKDGGGIDKFRIKIWDKTTGATVYDNQIGAAEDADPVTAIAGGSIVIHK